MGNYRFKNQLLEYWEISDVYTASHCIARRCIWNGLIFVTDNSNNITVNVYDNNVAAASARRIWPTNYLVIGTDRKHVVSVDPGIYCDRGIAVVIAVAGGGTCSYQIVYNIG